LLLGGVALAPWAWAYELIANPPAQTLRASTTKPFKTVVDEVDFAIAEHNFRITGRNTVGSAIRERGHTNFPEVEILSFCNLENARKFIELDNHYAGQMPCRIAIYQAEGKVWVSAPLLPEKHADPRLDPLAKALNKEIRDIVEFAVEQDAGTGNAPLANPGSATPGR
jgi:uncharacterized protein (DUF302 family)